MGYRFETFSSQEKHMNSANAAGSDDPRIKYTLVIGGVTHLTWLSQRPADGVVVRLLCGSAHRVGSTRSMPPAAQGRQNCVAEWKQRFGS
jgi:hypothetical protein